MSVSAKSTRVSGASRRTPERILAAALTLFNEQGARTVSTNHICQALGISPGNLYYHFRSKAEIVAALFARYQAAFRAVLDVPVDRTLAYEDKVGYFEAIFETLWAYRFLHRDMDQLLREDDALRAQWRAFAEEVVQAARHVLGALAEAGMMRASEAELDALTVNMWVLVTSWTGFMTSLSAGGDRDGVSPALLKRGIYQMICLEEPYLVPAVQARLPELKRQYLMSPDAPTLASLFRMLGETSSAQQEEGRH